MKLENDPGNLEYLKTFSTDRSCVARLAVLQWRVGDRGASRSSPHPCNVARVSRGRIPITVHPARRHKGLHQWTRSTRDVLIVCLL